MLRPYRPIQGAALCLSALLCAALPGCRHADSTSTPQDSAPVAPVAEVERGSLSNSLDVAGEFMPYQEVELHAKVAGYIRRINADIGDRVHAGEVLATLDIPEINAQVQGASATVAQSGEQITRAQSDLQNAQASYQPLKSAYDRLRQASAAQPGLIAEQELDNAQARAQVARAQVEASRAALAATRQSLQVSRAGQQQVSAMQSYARITAPFSGVVTARYADPGALIQAGTSNSASAPVLKIAEVDKLRLRLPVPASMASFVHDGDSAQIHINELGRTINGKVSRSTDALDPSTRTEQAEIDVPNPDGSIKPGMYATVSMPVHRAQDALVLPINAVNRDSTQAFVMLVDASHHVQHRDVQVGLTTPNRVEILSGPQGG